MGSWPPRRVRVPPSGLGNGTLLGYGVFRMELHQDEAPPDAGGPYPGDWRPHETREGWTQTRGRDNVRRRCTRRRPRDEAAAIGAARATAGGGGRWPAGGGGRGLGRPGLRRPAGAGPAHLGLPSREAVQSGTWQPDGPVPAASQTSQRGTRLHRKAHPPPPPPQAPARAVGFPASRRRLKPHRTVEAAAAASDGDRRGRFAEGSLKMQTRCNSQQT